MTKTEVQAEATAVLRSSGKWFVHLGPASVLPRIVRRRQDFAALERRLGALASCAGALVITALEEQGMMTHVIRVSAKRSIPDPVLNAMPKTLIRISIECEADQHAARACCDSYLRMHPLFLRANAEDELLEIEIETHSSVQVRFY